jgi:hypothetical protein
MKTLHVRKRLSDSQAAALQGTYVGLDHCDHVVRDTTTVLKENGDPLFIYLKDEIPRELCERAYHVFKYVNVQSANRGAAAGLIAPGEMTNAVVERMRFRPMLKNGTISKTSYARPVNSAIAGYFDRNPRLRYCRMTAFNSDRFAEFERARPFVRWVSDRFAATLPDRHALQHDAVAHTHRDFVIVGTVFTTVTINKNWRTSVHQDKGDHRPGFGVMAALEGGSRYEGYELIFPQYRAAVDLRTGGLLLADVHEFHGNAPLVSAPGRFLRLSMVFYYRTGMLKCGSAAQEFERAKRLS